LVSDASPDGNGFAIEGIARSSGKVARMRIPMHVVEMLQRELRAAEKQRVA